MGHSSAPPDPSDTSGVTIRSQKRKKGDELENIIEKMESMFNMWTKKQDVKYDDLLRTVHTIKEQNEGISISLDFISKQYEEMKNKLSKLEIDRRNDQIYIQALEKKVEFLEVKSRNTTFEIRNVPIYNGESTTDLCGYVKNLSTTLQIPFETSDIKNIYRGYSKSEKIKPIVVELLTVLQKEKLLNSVKTFKKLNTNSKLNTSHLKKEGAPVPIYVSDYLSAKMKRLHFMARDYAAVNNFKFCWATSTTIYLRKKEGEQVLKVRSEQDLQNLNKRI